MLRFFLILVGVWAGGLAWAQGLRVRLSPEELFVGDAFRLEVSAEGASLKSVDFAFSGPTRRLGQTQSFMSVNGRTSSTLGWRILAEQEGTLRLERLSATTADGRRLTYDGHPEVRVRALVAGMRLLVRRPSGHPLAGVGEQVDFLSVVPMQLYDTLQDAAGTERLARVRCVIVGGGAVDEALQGRLSALPCRVYSTYGMTETLSHVALRPLNGPDASEAYTPFAGVRLSLSPRGTLVIHAPEVCAADLETNDVVRLHGDGTFTVVGRADNTVNSGGIKIQIEEEERRLKAFIPVPFALTSVPDERLGEALVLLLDAACPADDALLMAEMRSRLPRYHAPRRIVRVSEVPRTENGKTDRGACRRLAGGKR